MSALHIATWGLLLVASMAIAVPATAREVPSLAGRVNDEAGVLSTGMRSDLERRLREYEQATGHQFAVLIVRSLEGDPLEDFSIRVVEAWKLGGAEADDGLLLLVAVDDRKMRIEVGYGLEGSITDLLSSRIIRQVLTPAFRSNDFDGGIRRAMDLLMRAAEGEAVRVPGPGASTDSIPPWLLFALIVGFVVLSSAMSNVRGGRRAGWYAGGMGALGGRGGFGGGGFGGGGFSGGGGGFGGGGASGSW